VIYLKWRLLWCEGQGKMVWKLWGQGPGVPLWAKM
jgi:hypothetical protein